MATMATRIVEKTAGGPPLYTYEPAPGVPPVGVLRLDRSALEPAEPPGMHAHDFPGLAYFERGGGSLRADDREWAVEDGDLYVVAPGAVMGVGSTPGLAEAEGWAVYFTPEALGPDVPGAFLAWRTHPLLFPFVRGTAGGLPRLRVAATDRARWWELCAALERELRERSDGYEAAALAHLTLLLVEVSRLAVDVVGDLKLNDEPLLAEVFACIEARYQDGISLSDVARAVNLSPGHLTTVVRRKTGRTVQQWIGEQRMAQARRMLVETDQPVEHVGRQVGIPDAVYFGRSFRRAHGVTPLAWRRAARG